MTFWFVLRWNIEVTFQESRANLGIETQRQWSDNAIQRTTPLLMALFSILTLIAIKMNSVKRLIVQETTSWYDKQGELTFADIIFIVRKEIWSNRYLRQSANDDDFVKFSDHDIDSLIHHLSLAA